MYEHGTSECGSRNLRLEAVRVCTHPKIQIFSFEGKNLVPKKQRISESKMFAPLRLTPNEKASLRLQRCSEAKDKVRGASSIGFHKCTDCADSKARAAGE